MKPSTDFHRYFSRLMYSDWTLPVYLYQSIVTTFNESWHQNMNLARTGEIGFDVFVSNLQEAMNLAILDEQLTHEYESTQVTSMDCSHPVKKVYRKA